MSAEKCSLQWKLMILSLKMKSIINSIDHFQHFVCYIQNILLTFSVEMETKEDEFVLS